jgi:hypothetical protein
MQTGDSADLLTEIDGFLARTRMAESTFGQKAIKNSKLLARMRAGGTITLTTARKLRDFIATYEPPQRRGPDREARHG